MVTELCRLLLQTKSEKIWAAVVAMPAPQRTHPARGQKTLVPSLVTPAVPIANANLVEPIARAVCVSNGLSECTAESPVNRDQPQ